MGTEPLCSLLIANHGRYAVIGSSSLSLPASRSCITAVAVNSFEIEATRYSVSGVAGVFASASAKPNPRAQTSRWSWTIPIDRPGGTPGVPLYAICHSSHAVSTSRLERTAGSFRRSVMPRSITSAPGVRCDGLSRLLFAPRTVGGPHLFAWLRDGEPEQRSAAVSSLTAAGRPAVASILTDAGTVERVQGTAIPLGEALGILSALPADDLEIAPPTVAVWSLASKLALDLVARERIVPVIDATDAGAEARWGVSLLLPEDADRFRRLARAFPPAAHAIPLDGDGTTVWAAEDLLLSYLDEVANELALGTIDPAEARAGRWEGKL